MRRTLSIEWTDLTGTRRQVQFIPDTGECEGWRIESQWTGASWREVGRAPVSNVDIEASAPATDVNRGP